MFVPLPTVVCLSPLTSDLRSLSLPPLPCKNHPDGLQENHEIKLQGPVVDVVEIEIHPVLKANFIGNVQKSLHGLRKSSLTHSRTSDRAGTFSEVTGGRALSFHGLSMGETPGPERRRGEQREGQNSPVDKP